MAINATRGLPSFSEMYSAFKNRGSLGEALQGGFKAYDEGRAATSKENLQASEAEKNRAEAKAKSAPKEAFVRLDQILDPKEKQDLAQYATPNDQGVMVLPVSTYNAVTKRGQGQETLELKNQLALADQKAAEERATNAARLSQVAEEKAALQAQLGPEAQEISATRSLAEEAGKVEAPTLFQRGASFIKEKVTGKPLSSVLAERQGEAARAKLATLGNVGPQAGEPLPKGPIVPNPVDEATGSTFNSKIPTINSTEEFNKLPAGSQYYDSYGNLATKPGKKGKK